MCRNRAAISILAAMAFGALPACTSEGPRAASSSPNQEPSAVASSQGSVPTTTIPPTTPVPGPRWTTYRDADAGFRLSAPPGWRLVELSGRCSFESVQGVALANGPAADAHAVPSLCGRARSRFPKAGAAVSLTLEVRFPQEDYPDNTPVPLSDVRFHRFGDVRRVLSVVFHHRYGYILRTWAGDEAIRRDRRAVRRVIESIRPWTPPRPNAHLGECVDGWERAAPPSGARIIGVNPHAVAASSVADAWVVGGVRLIGQRPEPDATRTTVAAPLALHWDGVEWSRSPAQPTRWHERGHVYIGGRFTDVASVSATDVWAVGADVRDRGLTEHWDGTRWTVVPSPTVNLVDGQLIAVAASGPNDAWAVGAGGPHGVGAVVEHWGGSSWTLSSLPELGTRDTWAQAVSASSPSDAWVVGHRFHSPLALHWNGNAWRLMRTPALNSPRLNDVIDFGPTDAWVAGTNDRGTGRRATAHAIVEHWDGSSWTLVGLPPLPEISSLERLSGSGPDDIWARGWGYDDGQPQQEIILHYAGGAWTRVNPPGSPHPYVVDVAAIPGDGDWLVGFDGTGSLYRPDRALLARSCGDTG